MFSYLSYKQAIKDSEATQDEIDDLAREVNKGWWQENKDRFPGIMDD